MRNLPQHVWARHAPRDLTPVAQKPGNMMIDENSLLHCPVKLKVTGVLSNLL